MSGELNNCPVISVQNLCKSFGGSHALHDVNFDIGGSSITALLGGNGAGKTTTLSILLGLMLPTSGNVSILGHDMLRDRFRALARMNFSSPYVDLPNRATVRQNLVVYGHLYGVSNIKDRIRELAEDLQLNGFLDRPHGSLSAGQKTRATLAKSLLNNPALLLLDEPTASLDPDTADWVRRLLVSYHKKTGATILMASHNMIEVERMCDDAIFMHRGRIVDRNSPENLIRAYGRSTLEDVFLTIARSDDDVASIGTEHAHHA